jgi:hypothetical protein
MRVLSCEEVETALLAGGRADDDGALAAHLAGCPSCADFEAALRALAPLAASPRPSAALVERTAAAAGRETRELAIARRRAVRRAGLQAALAFLASAPFLVAFQVAVVLFGRQVLPGLLPHGALLYVEVVWGLFVLAALSAVAFTLTLVAGAAARPPRADALLEARHG